MAGGDVAGGAVGVDSSFFYWRGIPGRLPRSTDRADGGAEREAEVRETWQAGGSASARRKKRCRMIPLIVDLEREWRGGQNQAFLLMKGLYERGHAAELVAAKGSSLGHRCKKEGFYVHYVTRGIFRLAAAR